MELNQVLKRVRQFVAKAEAPIADGATPAEREAALIEQATARAMADKLMEEYAVTEAEAEKARPVDQRQKPGKIEVALASHSDVSGYVASLADLVARHCRCLIRLYSRYDHTERMWMAKVYGFESDVRYFEILYTTLRLHMIGAVMPQVDKRRSLDDNVYTLRNAGYSWRDIAAMYGWNEVVPKDGEPKKMFYNKSTGEREPLSRSVDLFAKAYKQAVAKRHEPLRKGPVNPVTFRLSAAQGYTTRINGRLREAREGRHQGASIILRSRMDDLHLFFKKDNPDLFQPAIETDAEPTKEVRVAKLKPRPFSAAGYQQGVSHANTATLNPGSALKSTKEIS